MIQSLNRQEQQTNRCRRLIELDTGRLQAMLPSRGMTLQPHPIGLCGAYYAEVPCHRMVWQYKDVVVYPHHNLRLLERCPSCKTA